MKPGYGVFELDLPEVLLTSLVAFLGTVEKAPLTVENTKGVEDAQGIYQLFYKDELVYIGKTDSNEGLQGRLTRHAERVLDRPKLDVREMKYKAVRIMVFTAMDLETSLIAYYKAEAKKSGTEISLWNNSGFGSNDPGRQREETDKPIEGFDGQFPIDIDKAGPFLPAGTMLVSDAVKKLKDSLHYLFRYQTVENARSPGKAGQFHSDLKAHNVTIPPGPLTARQTIQIILAALPSGWQATLFVSHVILYKEAHDYTHGTIIEPGQPTGQ